MLIYVKKGSRIALIGKPAIRITTAGNILWGTPGKALFRHAGYGVEFPVKALTYICNG